MNRVELLEFVRSQTLAVQASVAPSGGPQAAVVAFVVTDDFEILFDALDTARKIPNLRNNPRIALVIGGLIQGDERTVQYEGVADEPRGAQLERLKEIYFARFPEGRDRQTWPGIVYVRVRPRWVRYSDYNRRPPEIAVFKGEQLRASAGP
ncbi:MAG TPA: pyridoxamine 5'-phosphate oxidase family protein [Planctomycetota bacterium]